MATGREDPDVGDESTHAQFEQVRRRLRAAGATEEELTAPSLQALYELSADLGARPAGAALRLDQAAARAGVDPQLARRVFEAAGLWRPDAPPDAPVCFESDLAWLGAMAGAVDVLGERAVVALVRRARAAMSQLAHASSATFRVATGGGVAEGGETPLEAVERNLSAAPLVALYLDVCEHLYRHELRTTVRHGSVAAGDHGELRFLAVGFVDVASSTALSASVSAAELAGLVASFESAALTVAGRHGARVVKTIGDEVMLAAMEPAAVCRAALDLVDWCGRHDTFADARGGVAAGDVLEQDGDCFGPVVNRAARFTAAAPDGSVVIDEAVATALTDGLATAPLAPVDHRGLGPLPWFALSPATDPP